MINVYSEFPGQAFNRVIPEFKTDSNLPDMRVCARTHTHTHIYIPI